MKTGWNRLLSVFLALVLVLGCLPAAALAAGSEEGVYQYTSNENGNKQETDDFQWYDSFTRSSFEGCDHLRLLSAQVAISSASYYGAEEDAYEQDHSDLGRNVKAMLTAMGFEDVEANAWYAAEAQENSAAVAVGHRSIEADGKAYTLLAVIPRSAGYKQEWAGNFTVGSGLIHEGFKAARDEDLRFVKQYIGAHGITGDIKVWISGHSRGAAVANILGAKLTDRFGADSVYAYTFATPRTVRGDYPAYDNIFNVINPCDMVPMLPLEAWGFERYGIDRVLPVDTADAALIQAARDAYDQRTDKIGEFMVWGDGGQAVRELINACGTLMPTVADSYARRHAIDHPGLAVEGEAGVTGSELLLTMFTSGDMAALTAQENDFAPLLQAMLALSARPDAGALTANHMPGVYGAWMTVAD